jgi:hypothetical protein
VRDGKFAAKSSYLRYEGNRVPFVVPERLAEQLRDGYTLIVDAVDDMTDGVMQLAEEFERLLRESVQVNMYAGWRELLGFHRHCDTHDVIVLQVYGSKKWRIYEGGRPHPLKEDSAANDEVPQKMVWEGVLNDGDVLYIPRGWWHEASGIGEVTLHLTFGIHQRTGVNLLHWMADRLRDSDEFRADLLRFGSPKEREAQLKELRRQFLAMFDDDVLRRYFEHGDTRARSRGWASLPWTVVGEPVPVTARVSLDAPRALKVRRDDTGLHVKANGRAWQFAPDTEPLLRTLERGSATVAELQRSVNGTLDATRVQQFVTELLREGLVRVERESGG